MNERPEPCRPPGPPVPPKARARPGPPVEIHEWPELRGFHDGIPDPPGPEIVRAVLVRSALTRLEPGEAEAAPAPGPYRAWALLTMEARLLHPAVWPASALVMAAGAFFVMAQGRAAGDVLSLVVSLVALAGLAMAYGPEHDDAFELVAATPVSPRVILLARVTLVFGYDLALALLASAAMTALPQSSSSWGMMPLITAWLGPMAMLAALSLLLSVCWNPAGAMGTGLAIWVLHAMTTTGLPATEGLRDFWTTSPLTIGLALALGVAAVAAAGTGEPIRRARPARGS
ncbi:hypothetical protein ACIBCT_03435 [Streptosporangium sp. NPDC050855]|uniref:hypothetical protein n=1 Tax=Streptosporangium sp. NPDC050855 TaxID=3366194 RepID=UPI00379174E0